MSSQLWLERVQRELSRRRLPRREVARLVAELSDHLADVMESRSRPRLVLRSETAGAVSFSQIPEEPMSMDATVADCLGSPVDIADAAEREYRRRKPLLSRSRLAAFCTFVLLPIPALCIAWVATFFVVATGVELAAELFIWLGILDEKVIEGGHLATPMEQFLMHATMVCIVMFPAAAVAALFGRLAKKTGRLWHWGLAALLLLAIGTALTRVQLTFSDQPGKSTLMVGLAVGWDLLQLFNLGQFVIPFAVGILVLRRAARQASTPVA